MRIAIRIGIMIGIEGMGHWIPFEETIAGEADD
jgi:hypothetical protein